MQQSAFRSIASTGIVLSAFMACRMAAAANPESHPRDSAPAPRVILIGGTDELLLLTDEFKRVRDALQLTAEQHDAFDKLASDIRSFDDEIRRSADSQTGDDRKAALAKWEPKLRPFCKDARKRLAETLTTDQWERLGELAFQGQAPGIPIGTILEKALGLTRDQLKKRGDLQAMAEVQADVLQQAVRNGELAEGSKTSRDIRENCERFMLEVLTHEQRVKLEKMKGTNHNTSPPNGKSTAAAPAN